MCIRDRRKAEADEPSHTDDRKSDALPRHDGENRGSCAEEDEHDAKGEPTLRGRRHFEPERPPHTVARTRILGVLEGAAHRRKYSVRAKLLAAPSDVRVWAAPWRRSHL